MDTSTMRYLDKTQFSKLLKGLKGAYTSPNSLPDKESIAVWYEMLKDIPYEVLSLSVQMHIATSQYPPTIAEIRSGCADILTAELDHWTGAWSKVLDAVSKYGLTTGREAMEQFDEITAEAVRRVGYWAICNSENISVERANFRTAYEQLIEQKKQKVVIPQPLQLQIEEQRKNNLDNCKLIVDKQK